MASEPDRESEADQVLVHAFARLDPKAMGVSLGLVMGSGLFLATAFLLVKAAFDPGAPVGPHLALLGVFFPGYAVSWPGAALGLLYGFLAGFALGLVMAALLNLNHLVYLLGLVRRQRARAILDGL